MSQSARDEKWLRRAISLADLCPPSPRAFSVGCVIVDSTRDLELARGYSRELNDRIHAEEAALTKLKTEHLDSATLYSSLEPCSTRLSGQTSCTARILARGIKRVVFAMSEPDTFVHCEGRAQLEREGVEVLHRHELSDLVRATNAHLFKGPAI